MVKLNCVGPDLFVLIFGGAVGHVVAPAVDHRAHVFGKVAFEIDILPC